MAAPLREYTPVMTSRFTNIVDASFKKTMGEISSMLKTIFHADSTLLIPGSGTFAMEAVARQFGTNKKVLLLMNGYFGYRWSEIISQGSVTDKLEILRASPLSSEPNAPYIPPTLDDVQKTILNFKPDVVIMSHVDTSTGLCLPSDYMTFVSKISHENGAIVVLDCIASGMVWTNMKELGLDVIVTAPQKAFCAPASVGIVLLSSFARKLVNETKSSSFSLDLKKWAEVMEQYEVGGFLYHTTMPTQGIERFHESLNEIMALGIDRLKTSQIKLGENVRQILQKRLQSVAAVGFESPTVLVFYCEDPNAVVARFRIDGYKVAGGLSFCLNESEKPKTFRIGLFGLEKLEDIHSTTSTLESVINSVFDSSKL